MVDDAGLHRWFVSEVLPLERALMAFLRRNWRAHEDLADFRQDIYEKVLAAAAQQIPSNTKSYVFVTARNHLINAARRQQVVSFELVADLEEVHQDYDMFATERHLNARDELRRTAAALEALPPRCREVVRLRKVEGYSTKETAELMGVGVDTIEKQITHGMRAITDFMLGGTGKVRRPRLPRRRRQERLS